jgi:CheY-like chemotaxis protein
VKKTILIADENHAYMMHISIILKKMGFRVLPCDSDLELLKTIHLRPPDLILLDIHLSGRRILEALESSEHGPALKHIPIVLISSDTPATTEATCASIDCATYVLKPLNLRKLHNVLQEFLYPPHGYMRKNLRAMVPLPVTVRHPGGTLSLTTESISEGGVYVISETTLPTDTRVEVVLALEYENTLAFTGRVIYVNDLPAISSAHIPHGMAIEFDDTDKEKMALLSEYVTGLLTIPLFRPSI